MPAIWIASALCIGWFLVEGVRQGVVRRIVELVGLLVVFLFASRLAGDLEPILHEEWGMGTRAAFFGSWIVVLVGGILLVRLVSALTEKIVRLTIASWLDRVGGGLLGAGFGAIVVSCLLIVVLALPVGDSFKRDLRDDPVSDALLHLAPSVYDVARGAWHGDSFFDMIREHVEPMARDAAEQIRATVEDIDRDDTTRQ